MAKIVKNIVDADLRARIFDEIMPKYPAGGREYIRINDRQYGIILTDLNGVERYIRIGAIVAEERESMTARELMLNEISEYNEKQEAKAEKAAKKAEKIAKDKAKREAKEQEARENA